MTTPRARYEAQGVGGILNIITQKKIFFKSSGYLNAGAGTKGSHLMGNFNNILSNTWSLQNSFYSLIGYSKNTGNNSYSDNIEGNNVGQLYSYMGGISRNDNNSQLNLGLQYLYQGTSYKETRQDGKRQKTNSGYHYASTSIDYNLTTNNKTKIDVSTRFYFLPTHSTMNREYVPNYESSSNIFGQISRIDFSIRPLRILNIDAGVSSLGIQFRGGTEKFLIKGADSYKIWSY